MATLKNTGLKIRTIAEIKQELETEQQNKISPAVDTSSTSLLGQLNSIYANQTAQLEEALASIYNAMDPTAASGDALERIAAFTGTTRDPASRTSVTASLFFSQAGTFSSGTLLANPVGNESALFENVHDVVVTSAPTTASNVLMRAQETGPTRIILGQSGSSSLTEIASPVAGWEGLYASASLFIGTNEETDTHLREKRVTELFNPGSTSVNGIASQISNNVSGVLSVTVFENTGSTIQDSIPAHGIEAIVYGPSAPAKDIATEIFKAKSAGTPTAGNKNRDVTDSAGNAHTIKWTEPVQVPVTVTVDLRFETGESFPGVGGVKDTILTNASSSWVPGLDVFPSQISSWVQQLNGVLSVDTVKVDGSTSQRIITKRQIAAITSSNDITVNPTKASP